MAHPALIAHSAQFEKSVVALTPGMWTVIEYAAQKRGLMELRRGAARYHREVGVIQ